MGRCNQKLTAGCLPSASGRYQFPRRGRASSSARCSPRRSSFPGRATTRSCWSRCL